MRKPKNCQNCGYSQNRHFEFFQNFFFGNFICILHLEINFLTIFLYDNFQIFPITLIYIYKFQNLSIVLLFLEKWNGTIENRTWTPIRWHFRSIDAFWSIVACQRKTNRKNDTTKRTSKFRITSKIKYESDSNFKGKFQLIPAFMTQNSHTQLLTDGN